MKDVGARARKSIGQELDPFLEGDSGDQRLKVQRRLHVFNGLVFDADVGLFVAGRVLCARKFQFPDREGERVDAFL